MKVVSGRAKLAAGVSKRPVRVSFRSRGRVVAAALAFACGACLVYAARRAPLTNAAGAYAVAHVPCDTIAATLAPADPAPAAEADEVERDTPELEDWKNTHSGAPLPLDDADPAWGGTPDSKVLPLPSGRMLVGVNDKLYMLGAGRRVVWKYEVPQTFVDFAYVGATGLVYVTAGDNCLFILDARTGRRLYANSRNGSAAYGATVPYGDDACLVMDNFAGYRMGREAGYAPMQDGVTAWRGTEVLWHAEVPPDAELQVTGTKIFAVTKTRLKVFVKEIRAPKGTS